MPFGMKVKGIWGETGRVEKILLFVALGFRYLATLLTWYALEQGTFVETIPGTRYLISKFGAPLGLSIVLIIWIILILFIWVSWVSSIHRPRPKPLGPLLRIYTSILFFGTLVLSLVDVAHDAVNVFFRRSLLVVFNFLSVAYIVCAIFFAIVCLVVLVKTHIKKRE
jgi:hypothetical protein